MEEIPKTLEDEVTRNEFHRFLDRIMDACKVPTDFTNEWKCKKCNSDTLIDWFEKTIQCMGCDDI